MPRKSLSIDGTVLEVVARMNNIGDEEILRFVASTRPKLYGIICF